jgi:uncharacterized membrane protein
MILTTFQEFYDSIPMPVKIIIYVLLGILIFSLLLIGTHALTNSAKLTNIEQHNKCTIGMKKSEVLQIMNMKPRIATKDKFVFEYRNVHLNCDYDYIRITMKFEKGLLVDVNEEKCKVVIDRSKYTFK